MKNILIVLALAISAIAQTTTGGVTMSVGQQGFPPLQISVCSPPGGTQGGSYSYDCSATGGQFPYTWALNSGSLPNGVTITSVNNAGHLSGTLGTPGTYNFTLKVTDNQGTVVPTGPLSVTILAQVPGTFMVPSGGDNAHGCTFTQPCDGSTLAGWTAARAAVQLLPVGQKTGCAVTVHALRLR